jgi:hypothetical protein
MKKKTTRTLLLICSSLLLLISITVSAQAQLRESRRDRYERPSIVSGTVRWKKDKGVAPMGPGHSQPRTDPCDAFVVAALNADTRKLVAYMDKIASPFQRADEEDYYVCRYSFRVPANTGLYILATMGGVLLLPQEDRSPMYITDAWIGGSRSKPPAGYERSFIGHQYVTLTGRRPRALVNFEMIYARNDPN